VTFMLEQFGRPERNPAVQCDCERGSGSRKSPEEAQLREAGFASMFAWTCQLAKDVPH